MNKMSKTAIDAQRGTIFMMEPERLVLVTDKGHALYDTRVEDAPDENMVRNIMYFGVIEPVIVRLDGENVEVVAGRGRTKAAQEANRRLTSEGKQAIKIPCLVRRGQDADLMGVMLSENFIRRDDNPLAKSDKASRLVDMGKTPQEIAVIFGVTKQTVNGWLSLQNIAPEVRQAVEKDEIAAVSAAKLSSLPRKEQVEKLDDAKKLDERPTFSDVQKAITGKDHSPIKSRKQIESKIEGYEPKDDYGRGYIEALEWVLGKVEE
jgi:ParB family chromosome partitioning protein